MEDEGRTLLPMFLLEVGGFMLIGLKEKVSTTNTLDKKYQAINSGQLRNPSILRLRCVVSGLRYVGEVSNKHSPIPTQKQKTFITTLFSCF